MKKIVLSVSAALLLAVGAIAQVDLGFETWQNNQPPSTLQDPTGWTSFNTASFVFMPQTVYKINSNPAFGAFSAKVVTQKVPSSVMVSNPFRPFHDFDTVGLLCLGTIHLAPTAGLTFGQPIAISRPSKLTFSSKDSVVAGDSSFVLAYLTKWNPSHLPYGKLDTIASGQWGESSTGSAAWTSHTINMTYYSATIVPDSQQIFVSSSIYSRAGTGTHAPKIGSKYYVDGFCWDCTAGINELNTDAAVVSVSPNPATNEINFASSKNADYVEVCDITGRKTGMYFMQNNKVKIQTESFVPGIYLYSVMNDKKEIISRGKFEVVK